MVVTLVIKLTSNLNTGKMKKLPKKNLSLKLPFKAQKYSIISVDVLVG
jgi:hypothetical protein